MDEVTPTRSAIDHQAAIERDLQAWETVTDRLAVTLAAAEADGFDIAAELSALVGDVRDLTAARHARPATPDDDTVEVEGCLDCGGTGKQRVLVGTRVRLVKCETCNGQGWIGRAP